MRASDLAVELWTVFCSAFVERLLDVVTARAPIPEVCKLSREFQNTGRTTALQLMAAVAGGSDAYNSTAHQSSFSVTKPHTTGFRENIKER